MSVCGCAVDKNNGKSGGMKQFESEIISNGQISDGFYEMSMSWDAVAGVPQAGQFLTLRVYPDSVPLLRRPFAFAGYDESAQIASIIYQTRGRGTEILAQKQSGEKIDVIGPLGNIFPIDGSQKKSIAAAGGIGLGPILFLTSTLRKRGIDTEFVFGCRNKSLIPNSALFNDAAARICTDDGSAGYKGNTVQYINTEIKPDARTVIYGCGPEPMLKSLCGLTDSSGAKVWVSLEAMMACGVGACMGCAVSTGDGYQRVCKEGSVFDGRDIVWE
jgi:dihydroorotate dehydrogenase electron transfer subunit